MSPRPKVDRVARNVRLRRSVDDLLRTEMDRRGLPSINATIELAVETLAATCHTPPTPAVQRARTVDPAPPRRPDDQVQPRFKS